ncbi:MAG: TIGR00282 family metallophosphoesterase [Candidatus Aminicenantes bacterium]|nr:TIGR00282 family metallophosphoesterase [Candidatus Aminicenantes bacterium]
MPDRLRILFLGDVIGHPGRQALRRFLPGLVERLSPDLVIANGENAAGGSGITEDVARDLFRQVQILTSGNHIWDKKESLAYLDAEPRLLRPANYPPSNPGRGFGFFESPAGWTVAVLNLQGRVFMEPIDCPFRAADALLEKIRARTPVIIVDFHAEATSEKQALGWHLDGRVSAVIGTHTHVATADAKILPGGTAYLSDVGMVGGYHSVIGIRHDQALARFLSGRPVRFEPAKDGLILSGVLVEVDSATGRALSIRREEVVAPQDGSHEAGDA